MTMRQIPDSQYSGETHKQILDIATRLFAANGFSAVSMKDIAKAVGIKTSSIYYYYEDGKDALINDILSRFEQGYRQYYEWLSGENARAESLEALMDNMFNEEFMEMRNPIACYEMSLLLKLEQTSDSAHRHIIDAFYTRSIGAIQAGFDRLIESGLIPSSDTRTLAAIFMCCVMIGNDIRTHADAEETPPIDSQAMYKGLRKLLTSALTRGTLE